MFLLFKYFYITCLLELFAARKILQLYFVVACENNRPASRRREMRGGCIFRLPFLTLLLLGLLYVPGILSVVVVVAAIVTDIIFVVVYGFCQTNTIQEIAWEPVCRHKTLPEISLFGA